MLEAWARGAPRVPLVVSLNGSDFGRLDQSPLWAPRLREVLREAAFVLVDTVSAFQDLERHGVSARKVVCLPKPQSCDVGWAGPRGDDSPVPWSSTRPLRVLFAGPLVERQGLSYLLEAIERLGRKPPGARLRILGAGPLRKSALALAQHLGIQSLVEVDPGRGGVEQVAGALLEADVLACPSVTTSSGDCEAGPPPAILLALAAGVPVVATRHRGIPDAVHHMRTGLLVEERDVAGLASALVRLRRTPDLARIMAVAGQALIARQHDPIRIERQLEAVYLSTIGE